MKIIDAQIAHARYDRDFCLVEAEVSLLIKDDTRPVPYTRTIRTSAPVLRKGSLRARILADAKALYAAMHAPLDHPMAMAA